MQDSELIASFNRRAVIDHTRDVDPQKRPVTFVSAADYGNDKAVSVRVKHAANTFCFLIVFLVNAKSCKF